MKAVVWHGTKDVRVEEVPDPKIEQPTDAIVRITSTAICGSDLHLYDVLGPVPRPGRHPGPRADGRGGGSRARGRRARAAGRPGGDPVQHLLRALLDVRAAAVRAVRDHADTRVRHRRRAVRLHEAVRAGAWRAGGIPAGTDGAVRADQGAPGAAGRAVPLSLRHPADGVAGGGVRRHPARRQRDRLRPGTGRAVRHADRQAPRRPGDRRRLRPGAAGDGAPGTASRWSIPGRSTTCPRRCAS